MKTAKLLAFVAVLGMAGLAMAQEEAPKKKRKARPKGIMGKIVKVEGANVVIAKRTRGKKETTEVTVVTDDKTVVMVNRKKDALGVKALKKGMNVFITPDTGTAKRIMARTPRKKGEGGKDKDKGKRKRKGKDKGKGGNGGVAE